MLNQKNLPMKFGILAAVTIQFSLAVAVQDMHWLPLLLIAWTIGGTINHSMTLAMHELSHNLGFKTLFMNRVFGLLANAPLGIPSFAYVSAQPCLCKPSCPAVLVYTWPCLSLCIHSTFKRYHMEHHKYQGEVGIDVDVPTRAEGWIFRGVIGKVFWAVMQPLFYSIRPIATNPKPATAMEGLNWLVQLAVDVAVAYLLGWRSVAYLIASTLLGMGIHPLAGHFIAEHYTFLTGQETYSYYGPLNWLSFNVGYHNEHHDFPNVPGTLLPDLRLTSPELYDDLPVHSSWIKVIFRYIHSPLLGPFARVTRDTMGGHLPKELQR